MFKRFILLTLFLTLISGSAWAAKGQEGSVEVGPYVGYGFLGEYGNLNPKPNLLYGVRLGYFIDEHFSLESSFQLLFTHIRPPVGVQENMRNQSLRFNLLYNFMPEKSFRPFLTLGVGWEHVKIENNFHSDDLGINSGLGFRYFFNDWIAARIDGRYVYTEVGAGLNKRQHNFEGTGGISFFFGGHPSRDTDGDSVADKTDSCPNTPSGATVDAKGCPADADGDGVMDGIDQCPGTAKGLKVDDKGCTMDTDGDNVPDTTDQCADTPKGASVDEKGCPVDADGDGVGDYLDKCPDTAKGITVDAEGCPPAAPVDTDADGVIDSLDKCPDTKPGVKIDAMGCPLVTKARGVLKGVNFKFGKAELTPESTKVLDGVATALGEFPEVQVEVQGHTDSTGPEIANLNISTARAVTVAKYLASKGVNAERLRAKGYGGSKPIAPNKTKIGRAKNRRVELNWLDAPAATPPATAPTATPPTTK